MKTLTKVLSMLIVIVMCMSLFGVVAYADEEPVKTPDDGEVVCAHENKEVIPAVAAGCTSTGLAEGLICKDCNTVITEQAVVGAIGHSFAEGVCTACGAEDPNYIAPIAPVAPTPDTKIDDIAPYRINADATGAAAAEFEGYGTEYEKGSGRTVQIRITKNNTADVNYAEDFLYANADGCPLVNLPYTYNKATSIATIDTSTLDTLEAGKTYKVLYIYSNNPTVDTNVTLTIKEHTGASTTAGYSVAPRYKDSWAAGDGVLWFTVEPASPAWRVAVDDKVLGPMDYDTTMGGGYFYLGTALLESLDRGYHTVKVFKDGDTSVNGTCQFKVVAGDVTLKPKNTSKHVVNSAQSLTFLCSEPIKTVWVGNKELGNYDTYNYYTLSNGGKTITLTAPFLNNKLIAGSTYYLTVDTDLGQASTSFQILTTAQASSSPQTGDTSNLSLWTAMLLITGVAAAVAVPAITKKKVSE